MIAVAGSFLSELAAALCSFICVSLNSSVSSHHIEKPVQKISEIGHMALPLTLNRLLLSVLAAIEVVLIPQCLRMYGLSPSEALSLYGVFTGIALPCILFPSTVCICHSDALCCGNAGTWTPQKNPLYHTYHLYCLYPSRIFMHHRFLLWGKFCRNHTFP